MVMLISLSWLLSLSLALTWLLAILPLTRLLPLAILPLLLPLAILPLTWLLRLLSLALSWLRLLALLAGHLVHTKSSALGTLRHETVDEVVDFLGPLHFLIEVGVTVVKFDSLLTLL